MKTDVPVGMTKDIYMELKVEQSLVEGDGFDLIAMGRPEGAGCYCAANNLLSGLLDRLIESYDYLVVDNEAGMEHFSRLTQKDIDLLLLVSDPSRRGLTAACRIVELVASLPIRIGGKMLVVNQVRVTPESWPEDVIKTFKEDEIAIFPADPVLAEYDRTGKPTALLPADSAVAQAAMALFDALIAKYRK